MKFVFKTCGFMLLFFFLIGYSNAFAHSSLTATFPKGDAELKEAPTSLEVWFEDPVTVYSDSIVVINNGGETIAAYKPVIDQENPAHIIARLNQPLPSGSYTVKVKAITPDGYVLKESYRFTVLAQEKINTYGELKLLRASPGDGEITKTSVSKLELWFNQPIEEPLIGLFDDRKNAVALKTKLNEDKKHVTIETSEALAPGTYQASWFATPAKAKKGLASNEILGVYYFAVESFSAAEQIKEKANLFTLGDVGVKQVAYWLSFIGLLLLFGVCWFEQFVTPLDGYQNRRNMLISGLSCLFVVGAALFLFTFRQEVGSIPLSEFVQLKYTWIVMLQVVLIIMALLIKKSAVFLYGLCLLMWPFVIGHASYPRYGGWITMIISEFHLLAVAIWMGGLLALIVFAPRQSGDWLKTAAFKFSKWALWCMLTLVLTGVWMTLQYIPSFTMTSFIESIFGRALILKVLLLLIVVGIAFFQRRSVKQLSEHLTKRFISKLRTELLYGVIILFFAAILVVATPSAAEQGVYPKTIAQKGISLNVDVEPLFPGNNVITLNFSNHPDFKNVDVTLSMPPDWEKKNRAFKIDQDTYKLTGLLLHAAGTVNMQVTAKTKNGETINFPLNIVVPGEYRLNE